MLQQKEKAKKEKKLHNIKFSKSLYIIHVLLVDDVLIFGKGTIVEWGTFHAIINLSCESSRMAADAKKYMFILNIDDQGIWVQISQLFLYHMTTLETGFKYMG